MTPAEKREEFRSRVESQRLHLRPLADRLKPCVHRGEETGETGGCQTCGGTRQVPLYTCAVHGLCSLWAATDKTPHHCGRCPDREVSQ